MLKRSTLPFRRRHSRTGLECARYGFKKKCYESSWSHDWIYVCGRPLLRPTPAFLPRNCGVPNRDRPVTTVLPAAPLPRPALSTGRYCNRDRPVTTVPPCGSPAASGVGYRPLLLVASAPHPNFSSD